MANNKQPSKHLTPVLIWLAIYPLITVLLYLLGEWIENFPLPVKTLILTLIAVPVVYYFILPFYFSIIDRFKK
ncbi:hypothetical protein HHL16_08560 [Pseudoflavitalea sp. G-6-1-2]|uniref:hypothetical protein n=1 Tax=Pseudoflavitalea sp. G-6-1-2 TaxID=2728841 RepID=UPI00146A3821|nr:hypothetical protein [Pseudoflavitalea sp. G-6-1-2]NML20923.1 hypothetical protein [Pseudoflavitalea sp. G-6-1-2]